MVDIKTVIFSGIGLFGAYVSDWLGGWDTGLQTLIIFMAIDYTTGLIVAGVFKNSQKTEQGALESDAAWKGLLRKGASLAVVLIACRLDLLLQTNIIRDATVIAYIVNESLSITENIGLMGVHLPNCITNAIEALKEREQ